MRTIARAVVVLAFLAASCGDASKPQVTNGDPNNINDANNMNNNDEDAGANVVSGPDLAAPDSGASDMAVPRDMGDMSSTPDTGDPDSGMDMTVDMGLDVGTDMGPDMAAPRGVEPLYPMSGENWLDWVSNDGTTRLDATDTDCSITSAVDRWDKCFHGGELRVFELGSFADCTGVTATDALDVFDWTCDDSTGVVRVVSSGLQDDKSAADLVDFATASWRSNSVTATNGTTSESSPSGVWWSNPIVVDNDGGNLDVASTVYLVTQDVAALYRVTANQVTMLVQPGFTVSAPATATNERVLLVDQRDAVWIEGAFDALGTNDGGVRVIGSGYSVLMNVTSSGSDGSLGNIQYSGGGATIRDVTVNASTGNGFEIGSAYSRVRRVTVNDAGDNGFQVNQGSRNEMLIEDVTVTNGSVWLNNLRDSVIRRITVNNGQISAGTNTSYFEDLIINGGTTLHCVQMGGGVQNVYLRVYITAGSSACRVEFSNASTAIQVGQEGGVANGSANGLIVGAGFGGGALLGATKSGDTGAGGVVATSTVMNALVKDQGMPPTVDCGFSASGSSPNYHNIAATNVFGSGLCALQPGTNFSGIVRVDDATECNTNNTNLSTACVGTGDVSVQFGDSSSGVGAGPTFPLSAQNTTLRGVVPLPTGNDVIVHRWGWVSETACVNGGGTWDSNASYRCTSVILRNAYELPLDGVGNENGLCESDETCVYMPNIGAYQGEGPLVAAGTIGAGGLLENITLLQHMTNGQ